MGAAIIGDAVMRDFFRFLAAGLVLGLYTEIQLKLVAGIRPEAFRVAVIAYPVIVTVAFALHRLVDRLVARPWRADLAHYLLVGGGGLVFEWTVLGNVPGTSSFQLGMFAMWTTFCFGPRVLIRPNVPARRFWSVFAGGVALLVAATLLARTAEARVVITVLGLSAFYIGQSVWLLVLAHRARRRPDPADDG